MTPPPRDSGQPIRDEAGASYGKYEGNQSYAPPYRAGYGQGSQYEDEHIDVLAQRLSQRMAQGGSGKIQPPTGNKASPGMRLALAIVSVSLLVPLAAILMGGVGGLAGLVSFGAACLAIFLINAVFNGIHN